MNAPEKLIVQEIWRYPVKSMGGEQLDEVEVRAQGLKWDRGWTVRDKESGAIRGARYIPRLLMCTARYLSGTSAGLVPHAEIELPDGTCITTADRSANDLLSDAIGRDLELVCVDTSGPVDQGPAIFETGDLEGELRMMFGLNADDSLPDLNLLGEEASRATAAVLTYVDLFPVDILTTSSLRYMQNLLPDSELPSRRFRPNFLIDDDGAAAMLREREWIGTSLRLGTAEIAVMADCIRCTMASAQQPGLAKDMRITRTLVSDMNQRVSVYCNVAQEGMVRVGDPAIPLKR